jgi:tetratricopeptide (TPR) repeat protein
LSENLRNARGAIRAILDKEKKLVVQQSRIIAVAGSFSTALKAARTERRLEKDLLKKAVLSNLIATLYFESNDHTRSVKEALKTIKNTEIPSPVRADAYHVMGAIHRAKREYADAESCCKKALALTREGDDDVLINILNILGSVYFYQKKYSLALEYLHLYAGICEKINDKAQFARALHNTALTLSSLGRESEAVEYYDKTREIALEIGDSLLLAYTLAGLGEMHLRSGDAKRALHEIHESLGISEELGHKGGLIECHANLALVNTELGNHEAATGHAVKALSLGSAEEAERETMLPALHEVLGIVP